MRHGGHQRRPVCGLRQYQHVSYTVSPNDTYIITYHSWPTTYRGAIALPECHCVIRPHSSLLLCCWHEVTIWTTARTAKNITGSYYHPAMWRGNAFGRVCLSPSIRISAWVSVLFVSQLLLALTFGTLVQIQNIWAKFGYQQSRSSGQGQGHRHSRSCNQRN